MPNILHIFGCMERGGAELRTLAVMKQLNAPEFNWHVCALSGRRGILDDEVRNLGGRVHYVKLKDVRFIPRFLRLLRRHRIDVVHSHVHFTSGLLLRLAKMSGVPVRIAHFRNTSDGNRATLRRRIQEHIMTRWIDRCATHILAVSKGAMKFGWGEHWRRDDRCQVIYNGIDWKEYCHLDHRESVRWDLGISKETDVVIHVGRMSPQKNHHRLLEIFTAVNRRRPSTRLLLVGGKDGAAKDALVEKVRLLDIEDDVDFLGQRSDVGQLMSASDLMIFPSFHEGLPGVVLEACATGLPVLASIIPGTEEIAEYFSNVEVLSLSESDERWCDEALGLMESERPSVQEIGERFEDTPFRLQSCAQNFRQICYAPGEGR